MDMGFTRAALDRAATEEGGPLRFVAATEGVQADMIDLRMSGAKLDRYRANPVFLYGHQTYGRDSLPIGRATDVHVDGTRLMIDVEFDRGDEFAARVERKYRDGFMNAVSIGFDVHAWENGVGSYWKGGVAEKWELTELSAVPVPMDAAAVVEGGRSRAIAALLDQLGAAGVDVPVETVRDDAGLWHTVRVSTQLADAADLDLLALAVARALKNAPAPKEPQVPAGIATDAAQGLLAAFTTGVHL